MHDRARIALAEGVGTMILVVGGPGTAVLATGAFFPKGTVGVIGVAFAFGLSLLCAAYAIGSISGCHINPAVTVGLWIVGKTKSREVPWYVGGQLVGGVLGALVIFVIADSHAGFSAKASGFASNGYGAHSPGGFGLGAAIVMEIVFTGLFVFVIASTSRQSMTVGFTGLTVGLMLTLIHLITIPVDNTSVNPARSFATAVFQHTWALRQLWVFIVFPIIGAAIGAMAWRGLVSAEDF
ncbi:MAG TPA: aquaporin Z [Acidimicrobiia bacterium]|jgi:aquaporin Z